MKQFNIVLVLMMTMLVGFSSCEKMMYVESDRYVYADNNRLDSPNDSVFSLVGILSKFQKLGDQYVLLGELRGDLMDVTHNTTNDLIALNQLDYSDTDNEYLNLSNYYAVINNCNYLIQNMDTSIVVQGELTMLREVAAAKAIRAWTYLQMALNYNGAFYYEIPILTVAQSQEISSNKDLYFKDREALFDLLIADLYPMLGVSYPTYPVTSGDIDKLIPSMYYILGEIYLWKGMYTQAAEMYYQDIYKNLAVVDVENSSSLIEEPNLISINGYSKDDPYNNYFLDGYTIKPDWDLQYLNETTANMEYYINDDYGRFNTSKMYRYTYTDYCVKPTENAIQFFAQQPYLHQGEDADGNRVNIAATGDLRGMTGSMKYVEENMETLSTEGMSATEMKQFEQLAIYQEPKSSVYITTYLTSNNAMTNQIYLQSSNLAYLRYAEAINRAGKPSVALAVINNGLNLATLRDSLKVSSWELDSALVEKWSDQTFLKNVGTRTRGQGVSTRVGFFFENANPNLNDSILFVEKVLLEECALETAFKGNRFHDLLRYTNHPDAPNYIADALAKKFPERAGEFASKSVEDWFIPYPHQPAE